MPDEQVWWYGNRDFLLSSWIRCRPERVLIHLRSLGILKASFLSTRCFSTSKDSEEQSKDSIFVWSPISGKKPTIKENAEVTQKFQAKLSNFVRSYEKFFHNKKISYRCLFPWFATPNLSINLSFSVHTIVWLLFKYTFYYYVYNMILKSSQTIVHTRKY